MRKTLAFLLCVASPALAFQNLRNPDQRPSFGFEVGGALDVDSTQEVRSTRASLPREAAGHSLHFSADWLIPVADAWSLQAGGGLNSQQSTTDEAIILPASSADASSATGLLSLRGYWLDRSVVPESTENNPDRWPSVALTVSGSASLYRDEIDTFRGFSSPRPLGDQQTLSFQGDTRLPFSDEWTLLLNLTGSFGVVTLEETAASAGHEVRAQTLTYGGGFKYYFVQEGSRPAKRKKRQNPDRWVSLALTGSGQTTVGGHQTITNAGSTDTRDYRQSGWSCSTELRAPLSTDFTLRLGMGGGQITQEIPATKSNLGAVTDASLINSFAGLRYYF